MAQHSSFRVRMLTPCLVLCAAAWLTGCGGGGGGGGGASSPTGTDTPQQGGSAAYSIDQAISDRAQQDTIAFDCLAFVTGSLGADSFFPPGKVADFWGFQYLRDNDPTGMGHNTDFLTRAANNVLYSLTDSQRAQLISLAQTQVASINEYATDRFPLMKAFRRLLAGDLPAGTTGLSLSAVQAYSAQLYRLDGQMCLQRAQIMGGILSALTADQRAYLDSLVGKGMSTWPNPTQTGLAGLPQDINVAVMTYASDMFSWYAGSIDADVYFCPERHGTYFGSFYLKDAPAMGNPGYSISTTLTGDTGAALLAKLTPTQAQLVTSLVTTQKAALSEIVQRRRDIATQLRRHLAGQTADSATVMGLAARYGELDGEIAFDYATAFVQLERSLSASQKAELAAMRSQVCDLTPTGAFLYSASITMPTIPNAYSLFGAK